MAAFFDKVEPSFCPEEKFYPPKALPNTPGGVPDRSREDTLTPSGTSHKPHQAEVAPERALPRFSAPSAAILVLHPASPPSPHVVLLPINSK